MHQAGTGCSRQALTRHPVAVPIQVENIPVLWETVIETGLRLVMRGKIATVQVWAGAIARAWLLGVCGGWLGGERGGRAVFAHQGKVERRRQGEQRQAGQ